MRNYINENDIRLRAETLARDAPTVAYARCLKLLMQQLRADPRNARPPRAREIAAAGAWAQRAEKVGAPLSWFVASSASAALLRRFIARVRDAHADLQIESTAAYGHETVQRLESARLFANLDHMSFDAIDEKTRVLARRRRRIAQLRAARAARDLPRCPADAVAVTGGRRWRRIVSTGELGRIGDAMGNCTAFHRRTHIGYARRLINGSAEFWILESPSGDPLILLMMMTGSRMVGDIRRARNGYVSLAEPDVAAFMRARGPHTMRVAQPAPPSPPSAAPPLPTPARTVQTEAPAPQVGARVTSALIDSLRSAVSARRVRVRLLDLIETRSGQEQPR